MPAQKTESEHRVLIVGACQQPGPALAQALAMRGARVVALDLKGSGLRDLASSCAGRIEPLAMGKLDKFAFARIGAAWSAASLNVAVNLMPMRNPRDVNGQLRMLALLLRATARGLIAGKGKLINVVMDPVDPLNLAAAAMPGAFASAQVSLNTALAGRGLHVHLVRAPAGAPDTVTPLLRFLSGPSAGELPDNVLR